MIYYGCNYSLQVCFETDLILFGPGKHAKHNCVICFNIQIFRQLSTHFAVCHSFACVYLCQIETRQQVEEHPI